jgi:hypothetical protein
MERGRKGEGRVGRDTVDRILKISVMQHTESLLLLSSGHSYSMYIHCSALSLLVCVLYCPALSCPPLPCPVLSVSARCFYCVRDIVYSVCTRVLRSGLYISPSSTRLLLVSYAPSIRICICTSASISIST